MKYNIPGRVLKELCEIAKENNVERVLLFGSRARGTNSELSDIDIAVSGGNFDSFYWEVMENIHSLLLFDIVELDKGIPEELQAELKREAIVIYEKI